jgi:peptidoglycan/LPS O-acetylase OafA/YrhL
MLDYPLVEDAPLAPAPTPVLLPTHPARKPTLPALTGLRTVLAVTIMFFHFTPPHPAFLSPLIDNAYVFVAFFFLISGFVLSYNYGDRPTLSKRAFYLARISRVYPVYLLVLLLSLPFLKQEWQAHTPADFWQGVILTPFALQGWSPTLSTFWNTVGWTVPAEMMLYALFPFLLIALAKQAGRLNTPMRLAAAILVLWLAGILPHITYLLFNPDHLTAPATRFTYAYWLRALKFSPPAYLCTFSAGVLLARLHAVLPLSVARRGLVALAGIAGLTLFFAFGVSRVPYVLVHGSLLLPLFAILLIGLAGPNHISAVLAWRPITLLGETTFALYLLHFNAFLLIHLYHLPERLHVARFDPWISYAAIMAMALLVLKFYEAPARRFVLSLGNRSKASA